MASRDACIVSYSETEYSRRSTRSIYEYGAEAAVGALQAAGLNKGDVDGLIVPMAMTAAGDPFWSGHVNEYLGLTTRWLQCMDSGGTSEVGAVARAVSAIREGYCRCVLIVAADVPQSHWGWRDHPGSYRPEFEAPFGPSGPPGLFGLLARRFGFERGLGPDELAQAMGRIALVQRAQAGLNPNALLRQPLTMEEYLGSRFISEPIRLLDCVMRCNGGGALVVARSDVARNCPGRPVYVTGYAEAHNWQGAEPLPDITSTGFVAAGPTAFAQAGIKPDDVCMFQAYDDFTVAILIQLEALGFCGPRESHEFVARTDLSHRGALPLNTGGGQLSVGQPGLAGGMVNLIEAIRQLRGEAGERQVADARNAVVTGIGVVPMARNWYSSAVMVLEV